jgi:transcriptional regulator with XRE-family HTH domain
VLNLIRVIRKEKGMTLEDVALRCDPPSTAQTIGRLETGRRSLSLKWISRIAAAMAVDPQLLLLEEQAEGCSLFATLKGGVALAAKEGAEFDPFLIPTRAMVVLVKDGSGEYQSGDQLYCELIAPDQYGTAVNHDVLVRQCSGEFLFGRLFVNNTAQFAVMPLTTKQEPQLVDAPDWLAVVRLLNRVL